VPMGLLIGLAVAQLIPLPQSVVSLLSPARVAAYAPVLAGETFPATLPLTTSVHETTHSLRLALLAAAVLMAVTCYVRDKAHLHNLLTVVFSIGCLEAAIAIAQIATGAEKLYWSI